MDSKETRPDDAELGVAIENAARKLPEGWHVCISIERDGYSVKLFDPYGEDHEFIAEETLVDDINKAVEEAIVAEH